MSVLPIIIKCYPTSNPTTQFPKYPLWALSLPRLFPSTDSSTPISQLQFCSPCEVQLKLINSTQPFLLPWKKGTSSPPESPMQASLAVSRDYGYYNHALNERENKRALPVAECYPDVILIIMVASYLHHRTMSCTRSGIMRVTFVSPKVLYTIKFMSKFFQWMSK